MFNLARLSRYNLFWRLKLSCYGHLVMKQSKGPQRCKFVFASKSSMTFDKSLMQTVRHKTNKEPKIVEMSPNYPSTDDSQKES